MLTMRLGALAPKIIGLAVLPFFLGCAKDHGKPIATLSYGAITAQADVSFYDLRFRSDLDLIHLFGPGEGFIGGRMNCALGDDVDFSVENFMQMSASGFIENHGEHRAGGDYEFVAELSFKETFNEGSTTRWLSTEEIRSLLADKASIPCRYVATIFGTKPYYSGVLRVPTNDILRELNK